LTSQKDADAASLACFSSYPENRGNCQTEFFTDN